MRAQRLRSELRALFTAEQVRGMDLANMTIIEGETGLLVEYGDATALAAALAQILDDPTGARELGRLGRERARDEFSWASIVARVEQLYLGLL